MCSGNMCLVIRVQVICVLVLHAPGEICLSGYVYTFFAARIPPSRGDPAAPRVVTADEPAGGATDGQRDSGL